MDGPRPRSNVATADHADAPDDPSSHAGLHTDREFQQNLRWVHEQLERAATQRAQQTGALTSVG